MVVDPVCKMQMDEKNSPATKYHGKVYHFCCPSYKGMFDKNPAKYA